jgi:DNA-binding CsgD family transcriptional regulator
VTDLRCAVVIGREAETAALRSALAAVRVGAAQNAVAGTKTAERSAGGVVFLTGEPGIGKSRLASELAADARAHGVAVLTGRAVPAGSASPYRPLTEALLQALRGGPVPDDDGLAPWRPALSAIVPAIGGAREPRQNEVDHSAARHDYAGPGQTEPSQTEPSQAEPSQAEPSQTEPSQAEPGQAEPRQAEPGQAEPGQAEPGQAEPGQVPHGDYSPAVRGEAVLQLLRRVAGPAGLLMVLEDLHWADPDTLAVVEYLSDNLAAAPVLCVATCRDEPSSAAAELITRLHRRRAAGHIALGRLTAGQVAAMVRACLPDAADDVITRVQNLSDGIPFLVEESLAAPGVPRSFAEAVRTRLAAMSEDERLVLHTAALFGRQFDWRLLATATGLPADVIARALEQGVGTQLLVLHGDVFRFRHMLTREAVIAELLPPRRAALAARALEAWEAAHPGLPGAAGAQAADLAIQAGHWDQAGALLAASGRSALSRGALATSIDTLRRAAELLTDPARRAEAETLLVDGLALAGRADEAMLVGAQLIAQLGRDGGDPTAQASIHLKLAHAAVDGTRWEAAQQHLGSAAGLLDLQPEPGLLAQAAVLEAEVAFARHEIGRARARAESALAAPSASAEIRCHALELLGRVHRVNDLDAARAAFGQALATADAAGLAVWRLRALHELGTIDMFDHAGADRLVRARHIAGELGAASTAAVIDLQLTAAAMFRFELSQAERHARSALDISTRLGLAQTRAIVLVFLAEVCALRRDREAMDQFLALAAAAAPDDPEIAGSALAGARGMLALLDDDRAGALDGLGRGTAILDTLSQQGPASYRGMWPLLLAAHGDRRAVTAIGQARRIGLTVNRANRGLLGYADAILAGRAGDRHRAAELAQGADDELRHFPVWADLARLCAAEPALADDWGSPRRWLEAAADAFARNGIEPLVRRCRRLLDGPQPSRWSRLGITDREADVLRLVAEGSSNKEIAARLHLSPRTVEKHVESLLRKTATQSRTQLVAVAGPEARAEDS